MTVYMVGAVMESERSGGVGVRGFNRLFEVDDRSQAEIVNVRQVNIL